jgi:uncharacterized membrane protein
MAKVTGRQRDIVVGLNRGIYWSGRNWLTVVMIFLAIYVGLPILAPVLMNAGLTGPANVIYRVYSPMCHQMASRSFFLFGEQYAYPRELAGTSLTPIDAYWDQRPALQNVPRYPESPSELNQQLTALRAERGDQQLGFKMALCERDIAIYGFMLIGAALYAVARRGRRIRPLPWWLFVIIGLGPIALDGFSQLFGTYGQALDIAFLQQSIFNRESTPFLRTATGALFGFTLVWTVFPYVDNSMGEFNSELEDKLARVESG